MINIVYAFLVVLGVSLIHGALSKEHLQAPRIRREWTIDPAGMGIQWDPVEGLDNDPIIGYRVKVWELAKRIYYCNCGTEKCDIVEKIVPERFSFDYSKAKPKWIVDVGSDVTKAEVNGVELDIFYEKRVQAITKNQEGPFSGPYRSAIKSTPIDKDVV